MKLIVHECPNCGAHLDIKDGSTKGKCKYCRVNFTLNNGIVSTSKVNNVDLKLAETNLYKFKDYDKSESIFKRLVFSLPDNERVYIGFILSITHDFTFHTTSLVDINNITDSWERYISLTSDENIAKYESKIKKYITSFWLNKIKSETNNFTDYDDQSLSVLNTYLKNYSNYASESDSKKLNAEFETYKIKRAAFEKKNNFKKNVVKFGIIFIILFIFIFSFSYLKNDKLKTIKTTLNTSEIVNSMYCNSSYECTNYNFLLDSFKKSFSNLSIKDANIDRNNSKIIFSVSLNNFVTSKVFDYEFDIIDDVGPYIFDNKCSFTDTDVIDLSNCYTIKSFSSDIEYNKEEVQIDVDDVNFKEIGEKSIPISFIYNGKTITNHLIVYIIRSDITFNFKLDKTEFEKNKAIKYTYTFSHDISNKDIKFDYNSSYITINDNNNTISGIKEGKTQLCAWPEYDESKIVCYDLVIFATCKGTYTFNYDGLSENKIYIGNDICPGIYKIYTDVVNNDKFYHLYIDNEKGHWIDSITITKKYQSNEEGKNFSFPMNHYLDVPIGITSVKLIKQ